MRDVATLIFAVVAANALLFAGIAWWAARHGSRDSSPELRMLWRVVFAVALALVIGSAARLAAVASELGWISSAPGDFLASGWQLAQSLAVLGIGVGCISVLRQIAGPLRAAGRVAAAVSDRSPSITDLAQAGLTPRELEVVAVVAAGRRSDKEIAEALYISPATAATHVRNILRKTGTSSRRDLELLALAAQGDSAGPNPAPEPSPPGNT